MVGRLRVEMQGCLEDASGHAGTKDERRNDDGDATVRYQEEGGLLLCHKGLPYEVEGVL